LNAAWRPNPDKTSNGERVSGASSAYLGANLNMVEHKSHLPLPPFTSSQDWRQSWCVRAMEPEHLHGLCSDRLFVIKITESMRWIDPRKVRWIDRPKVSLETSFKSKSPRGLNILQH
jgi:hypothetical protein